MNQNQFSGRGYVRWNENVPLGVELSAQDEHLQRGVQPAEGVDAVGDSGEGGVF